MKSNLTRHWCVFEPLLYECRFNVAQLDIPNATDDCVTFVSPVMLHDGKLKLTPVCSLNLALDDN